MNDKMDEAAKAAAAERRRALLAEYGLVPEEDLAVLLDVKKKTLRNRPASELPEQVHVPGFHGRLFKRDSVMEFLHSKRVRQRRKRRAPAPAVGASAPPVALFGEPEGAA